MGVEPNFGYEPIAWLAPPGIDKQDRERRCRLAARGVSGGKYDDEQWPPAWLFRPDGPVLMHYRALATLRPSGKAEKTWRRERPAEVVFSPHRLHGTGSLRGRIAAQVPVCLFVFAAVG
jgi:hypothetical protein